MLPITVDLNALSTVFIDTLIDSISDTLNDTFNPGINTAPIEPVPLDLSPIDLAPIEPAPLDLSLINLAPIEPALLDLSPIDLAPIEPAPLDLSLIEPAPIELTPIEPAPIEAGSYLGATYGQPDPLLNPFPQDTVVVSEASKMVFRWQDNWQPREIVVQKLYSESSDAVWANAYVPDGTFVFIREQEIMNGTQPVQGMTKADGTDYFWAQSGMTSGSVASQACISLPIFSFGIGHDLYDHLCTDFGQTLGPTSP